MRIAIVGTGGVGGYFGGRLAAAGEDVFFLARGAHLSAMNEHGLRIESPLGSVHLPKVFATVDPLDVGPVDVVLFTVKLYDMESALPLVHPLLGPHTIVIPFQNGVDCLERLAREFGRERVAGGTAHVTALVSEPGVIRHTALDRLIFGMPDGHNSPVLEAFRDAGKRAGFKATLSSEILVDLWAKFVRLTVFSGMTCIVRTSIGPIREDPALLELMEAAWHESILVARAKMIQLPGSAFADIQTATAVLPPHARSSMLEDLERGRRLELPWLSGAMVRMANELGVDTPTHRLFVTLLHPHVNGRVI